MWVGCELLTWELLGQGELVAVGRREVHGLLTGPLKTVVGEYDGQLPQLVQRHEVGLTVELLFDVDKVGRQQTRGLCLLK